MNPRRSRKRARLGLILFLPLIVSSLPAKETFKARMLTGKGSFEASQINVRIEIESWTTPEEIGGLQEAFNRGGYNAFENAFTAIKKGIARFMSARGLGVTVHAALSIPTEKGRTVLLFFTHQPWDAGSTFVSTSRNRFMVMDIRLDDKGSGEGRFYEFAKIRLRPELGTIEMEAFDSAPKILPIVKAISKK